MQERFFWAYMLLRQHLHKNLNLRQEINSHCQNIIVILRSSHLPAAQVILELEEMLLPSSAKKLQSRVQASLDEFPQCANEIDAIHIL